MKTLNIILLLVCVLASLVSSNRLRRSKPCKKGYDDKRFKSHEYSYCQDKITRLEADGHEIIESCIRDPILRGQYYLKWCKDKKEYKL